MAEFDVDFEFAWPKRGNKVFDAGRDQGKTFCFGMLQTDFFAASRYSGGFKLAADMVIDAYEAGPEREYHDELLYPVAYMYRHALEVKLKQVVFYGVQFGDLNGDDDVFDSHNLARLWTKTKELLIKANGGPDKSISAAESVINQFHQVDPSSQRFRYVTDKKGNPHPRNLPDHISIATLKKTMDGVFNFLDAGIDHLDFCLQSMPRDSDY